MREKVFLLVCITLIVSSCKKEVKSSNSNSSYTLSIFVDAATDGSKIYLQNLNLLSNIDSTTVLNGSATFKGAVTTPKRYLLTVENFFGGKMIIIENDSINIIVNKDDIINAKVTGSKLNDELISIQKKSEEIYNQIDLLFPDLQRARIENNAQKISEIATKMRTIEKENINFHFKYAKQHPNSFISAMILSDLIKRDSIDIDRVLETFNSFSKEIKKSNDAQAVDSFLKASH